MHFSITSCNFEHSKAVVPYLINLHEKSKYQYNNNIKSIMILFLPTVAFETQEILSKQLNLQMQMDELSRQMNELREKFKNLKSSIKFSTYIRTNYNSKSNGDDTWFIKATIFDYQYQLLSEEEKTSLAFALDVQLEKRPCKIINIKLGPKKKYLKDSDELKEAAETAIINYIVNLNFKQ